MTSCVAKITTCVVTLAAIAAIAAPSARASGAVLPVTPQTQTHEPRLPVHSLGIGGHDLSSALVPSQTVVASGPTGFGWSSAAVGALAAAATYVIAIGVVRNLDDKPYDRPKGGQP